MADSVLTRLPRNQRVRPELAWRALRSAFDGDPMTIEGRSLGALLDRMVVGNVSGGATHDAFVAETARQHEHRLVTLDQRAAKTYQLVGVEYVLLDASEL